MAILTFKPSIRRKDMDSVLTCMVQDTLGPGQLTHQLTSRLTDVLGQEQGLLFREYTRAIETTFQLLNLKEGDRIILSPLSPHPYAKVLLSYGLIPLYPDVDPLTGFVLEEEVERLVNQGASALVLHNTLGAMPDPTFPESFPIPVIEDISESFGAITEDKAGPRRGDITILALEEDKIITAGGGALVAVSSKEHQKMLKEIESRQPIDIFMPDLNASLGLVQLQDLEFYIEIRQSIKNIYRESLSKTGHKTFSKKGDDKESDSYFYSFPVVLEKGLHDVRQYALKKGVETHIAFGEVAYDLIQGEERPQQAASLIQRVLLFPLYPTLGKKNVELISKILSSLP